MSPGSDDHLRDLQRRLVDAERRLDRVPARWAQASAAPVLVGRIIGGNTLTGGIAGIKHVTVAPTIATAVDPYASPAMVDGVGYAYLYRAGVQQFVDLGAGPVPQRVLTQHLNSVIRYALMANEFALLGSTSAIAGAGLNSAYAIVGF